MLVLFLRRLAFAIPTFLVIIAVAFVLMHAAPGGPFTRERQIPPEIEHRLEVKYGLDLPLPEQFARYVGGLMRGDLGPSMTYKDKNVGDIIAEGAPTSFILGAGAMALALLLGGGLGVMAALRQNKPQDYGVMALAVLGVCLPPLVMGPLLQLQFGVRWHWLPTAGLYHDQFGLRYLALPILTLALPYIAIISRLMRAGMIEAMRSNAIRTARAKGMPERRVVWRHALPVAVLPLVAYAGPALAGVLAGSFVVETVFQLPGIGKQFIIAALQRDYTVVMGVILVYATLIILFNLAADLCARWLDPRSRESARMA
jgi:oligopeptide transport system permease protein